MDKEAGGLWPCLLGLCHLKGIKAPGSLPPGPHLSPSLFHVYIRPSVPTSLRPSEASLRPSEARRSLCLEMHGGLSFSLPVGVSPHLTSHSAPSSAELSLLCLSPLCIFLCGFSSCGGIYLCLCPSPWVQTVGLGVWEPRACLSALSHTRASCLTLGACFCSLKIRILIKNFFCGGGS